MNIYYAKTVLYAYPHIELLLDQIDALVEKRALTSMGDFSPCIEIAEDILDYTRQKDVIIALKLFCDMTFKRFTQEEIDLLDYKYFKKKPKEYYADFDFTCRTYYRRQTKIVNRFAKWMDVPGANDKWFEENCLKIDFFKQLLKRTVIHEKKMMKNKEEKKKTTSKKKTKDCNNEKKEKLIA